jgi:sucrose-6F-phosphate phosphohydrolase
VEDRYLLICDVDGTLLGDDAALSELAAWIADRRDRFRIVYNSGRFVESVRESIAGSGLPQPDAVIGGVGTEIRDFPTGRPIGNWLADRDGWDPARVVDCLSGFSGLERQPEEFQSDYKISYFARDLSPADLRRLRAALCEAGQSVELVYSSHRDLDLLPKGVNKGAASVYLADRWGVVGERVIVSGDSANDLAMFQHGFRGIVVGNAHAELKALRGPGIFQASRKYAAGVCEGLEHWIENGLPAALQSPSASATSVR